MIERSAESVLSVAPAIAGIGDWNVQVHLGGSGGLSSRRLKGVFEDVFANGSHGARSLGGIRLEVLPVCRRFPRTATCGGGDNGGGVPPPPHTQPHTHTPSLARVPNFLHARLQERLWHKAKTTRSMENMVNGINRRRSTHLGPALGLALHQLRGRRQHAEGESVRCTRVNARMHAQSHTHPICASQSLRAAGGEGRGRRRKGSGDGGGDGGEGVLSALAVMRNGRDLSS